MATAFSQSQPRTRQPTEEGETRSRDENSKLSGYMQQIWDGMAENQEEGQNEEDRQESKTTGTRAPSKKALMEFMSGGCNKREREKEDYKEQY